MKRIDVEQGTDEWHEARYRKVGGSTSKGLFVKGDTLMINVLSEFLEDFEEVDNYESPAMERGHELEGPARKDLSDYTGLDFQDAGWLQCEEIEILGISPDGITADGRFSCEIKCPGKEKHTRTIIEGIIPLDHVHQCLHYFTVIPELEKHYFASYRPESDKPLFVKAWTRDSLINLGTKAKPVLKTVDEWVVIAKEHAEELHEEIQEHILNINF
tara:strand:- start:5949 stop:6593 length:645 start_codon:yes stop_codon:yes gene_type:complete